MKKHGFVLSYVSPATGSTYFFEMRDGHFSNTFNTRKAVFQATVFENKAEALTTIKFLRQLKYLSKIPIKVSEVMLTCVVTAEDSFVI